MAIQFLFGVEDVLTKLGVSSLLSSAVLEPQGFTPTINQTIAAAVGNYGEVLVDGSSLHATTAYDIKQNFSVSMVCNQDAIAAMTIKLGGAGAEMLAPYDAAVAAGVNFGIYSKCVLTGFTLTQPSAGFAKISLNLHAHFYDPTTDTPYDHLASPAFTVKLPTYGFGIQQLPFSLAGNTQVALANFESYSLEASCGHEDELDRNGRFLIGASKTGLLKESFTLFNSNASGFGTTPQGALLTLAGVSGKVGQWRMTSDSNAESNTGYQRRSLSCEAYQLKD